MKFITSDLLTAIVPLVLFMFVISAAWIDCRTYRIPNLLVAVGSGIGLVLSVTFPNGAGSFNSAIGAIGILSALGGAAVGFGIMFPLYLTRTMGAGDVKLMAMIGTFLGPVPTLIVVFLVFMTGGALSLAIAIRNKTARLMLNNVYDAVLALVLVFPVGGIGKVELPHRSAGRMPYALAMAGGVILYFLFARDAKT
jgi:prepilin peptidase CpaA